MLFSEPKIPQFERRFHRPEVIIDRFSALQRAENSSIDESPNVRVVQARFSALQRAENSSIEHIRVPLLPFFSLFQCSSASRKFLNFNIQIALVDTHRVVSVLFSEPKIPQFGLARLYTVWCTFQCSSASRKFLNQRRVQRTRALPQGFSALQRAENSSIPTLAPASIHISDRDDHASSFLSLPGASP